MLSCSEWRGKENLHSQVIAPGALRLVVVNYVLRYYEGLRAVVRKVPAAILVSQRLVVFVSEIHRPDANLLPLTSLAIPLPLGANAGQEAWTIGQVVSGMRRHRPVLDVIRIRLVIAIEIIQ